MPKITVEKLYQSYGAYLRAKVQLEECIGWGDNMTSHLRTAIADYAAVEAEWIAEQLEKRRQQTAEFKAQLEGKR